MKFFRRASSEAATDRRAVHRRRVDCPATLVMPTGRREGRLFDLSETGARFETDDPPPDGCSAILEWDGQEVYGWTIWTQEDRCGFNFDKPIAKAAVDRTVALSGTASGRARADRAQIPMGRKRRGI